MKDESKVIKYDDFRWRSVPVKPYKNQHEFFKDVTRQTLLGEGEGESALKFLTRYFEVQPGGYSSFERHEHPHSILILRGTGCVKLGEETHDIGPFDCVYVSPGTWHQFAATGSEPLGFLCVVDRERDQPEVRPSGEWDA